MNALLAGATSLLAAGSSAVETASAGFLTGIWHGGLIVFRLLTSIFATVDVWSDTSTGLGYGIGFVSGAIIGVPVGLLLLLLVCGLVIEGISNTIFGPKYVLLSTRTYGGPLEPPRERAKPEPATPPAEIPTDTKA